MSEIESATQRIFAVEPESSEQRKCSICRNRATNRYLLAADEDTAESEREMMAEQGHHGMCAGCTVELLMGEGAFSRNDPREIIEP